MVVDETMKHGVHETEKISSWKIRLIEDYY